MARLVFALSNLQENLLLGIGSTPFIDRAYQAIERKHRAYRREDHRTDPQYSTRSADATSGHCETV